MDEESTGVLTRAQEFIRVLRYWQRRWLRGQTRSTWMLYAETDSQGQFEFPKHAHVITEDT